MTLRRRVSEAKLLIQVDIWHNHPPSNLVLVHKLLIQVSSRPREQSLGWLKSAYIQLLFPFKLIGNKLQVLEADLMVAENDPSTFGHVASGQTTQQPILFS